MGSQEMNNNVSNNGAVRAMDSGATGEIAIAEEFDSKDHEIIERIIEKYNGGRSSLISMLLDIQKEYNYLPKYAIKLVAHKLSVPEIQVYSVTTFYKVFSLKPRGKHILSVCLGTACHVRGGHRIVDKLQKRLNVEIGETTEDKQFTLETVRCLGACALGPVMVIDGEYHGQMNSSKIEPILKNYANGENNT